MNTEELRKYKRDWARRYREVNREKANERSKDWRAKNKPKRQEAHLQRTFGVSLEWYDETLRIQGGCAICKVQSPGGRDGRFHVDHDHKTGNVRGLLCNNCNLMVGLSKDDPVILKAAASYLEGSNGT